MKKMRMILLSAFGLSLIPFAIELTLFNKVDYDCSSCTDELKIHFIHGSYPKRDCIDQRKRVGGLLGGHVEIEIDQKFFGFEFNDKKKIHVFPRNNRTKYNSKFLVKDKKDWILETQNDKITSFTIPISKGQKYKISNTLITNMQQCPYDYAVFGMRCTSAVYEILAEGGILPEKSKAGYIFHAFYPRQLRQKMIKWAMQNSLKIERKEGISCRKWE